jgi:hypothetical protein
MEEHQQKSLNKRYLLNAQNDKQDILKICIPFAIHSSYFVAFLSISI